MSESTRDPNEEQADSGVTVASLPEVFDPAPGAQSSRPPDHERPGIDRPIVFAALAYVGGLSLGQWVSIPFYVLLTAILALIAAGAIGVMRSPGPRVAPLRVGLPLFLVFIPLGTLAAGQIVRQDSLAIAIAQRFAAEDEVWLRGSLAARPETRSRSIRLEIENVTLSDGRGASEVRFPLSVEAFVYRDAERPLASIIDAMRPGDGITLAGRLLQPTRRSHPGDFDEQRHMLSRGIGARFFVGSIVASDARSGVTSENSRGRAISSSLQSARDLLRRNIVRRLPEPPRSVALALVLGDRSGLDPKIYDTFKNSGLAHLFSVSGLHVSLILLAGLAFARVLRIPPRYWPYLGGVLLLAHMTLVEFRPAVVRAGTMGLVVMGGWALRRNSSLIGALATAALLTLALDPRNLMRIDWQLSYLCVLSILIFRPQLKTVLTGKTDDLWPTPGLKVFGLRAEVRSWLGRTYSVPATPFRWLDRLIFFPFAITLAVYMGIAPVQGAIFHQFALAGLGANLLAVPVAFATLMFSFGVAFFGAIPWFGEAIALCASVFAHLLLGLADFFDSGPRVAVPSGPYLFLVSLVYYGWLLTGSVARPGRVWTRVLAFIVFVIWTPSLAGIGRPGYLDVYTLDVGQGDAIAVQSPDGQWGLIDAGGGRGGGAGRYTVAPFLRAMGVTRLAFVAATHADADHVGGLDYIIQNFDVGVYLHGPDVADTLAFDEVERALAEEGIPRRELRAGDKIRGFGGVDISVLSPWPGQDDNNASLVLLFDLGDAEILLTGDIEASAERRILEEGRALDIDALKVAHHGSRTSSSAAFLEAFDPEIALISVGRRNRFSHPSAQVIDRLEKRGILVARTDVHGTIRLRTDGRRISVTSYAGP